MLAFLDPRDALRFALHVQRDALMAEHHWGKTGWQGSKPRQNAAKPPPSKLSPFVITSPPHHIQCAGYPLEIFDYREHPLKFVLFLCYLMFYLVAPIRYGNKSFAQCGNSRRSQRNPRTKEEPIYLFKINPPRGWRTNFATSCGLVSNLLLLIRPATRWPPVFFKVRGTPPQIKPVCRRGSMGGVPPTPSKPPLSYRWCSPGTVSWPKAVLQLPQYRLQRGPTGALLQNGPYVSAGIHQGVPYHQLNPLARPFHAHLKEPTMIIFVREKLPFLDLNLLQAIFRHPKFGAVKLEFEPDTE